MDERLALTDSTHNRWAEVALVIPWTVVVGADICRAKVYGHSSGALTLMAHSRLL